MALRRRDFLAALAVGAAGCAAPRAHIRSSAAAASPANGKKLRILVLGGTGFVGPGIVRAARAHGHTLTLFNRGKTNPALFADVETILGDRRTDLDRLRGREWDAVIDTWVMLPKSVRAAAELLKDHVGQYLFLSTISVYKLGKDPIDESSPVLSPKTVDPEKPDGVEDYGGNKFLAERAAEETMPGPPPTCARASSSVPAIPAIASSIGRSAFVAAARCSRRARPTIACNSSTRATSATCAEC